MAIRSLLFTAVLAVAGLIVPLAVQAASYGWSNAYDSQAGYRYAYPSALFSPVEGAGRDGFNYFATPDGSAKLLYGAWDKEAGETPASLKRWMVENAGGDQTLAYEPKGKNWFVISGYKDDQIYYQKVIFSCGRRIASVFAIAYPTAERDLYDPAVERMEDVFRADHGCR